MSAYEFYPRKHATAKVSIPCQIDHLYEAIKLLMEFANKTPASELSSRKVRITFDSKNVIFKLGVEE